MNILKLTPWNWIARETREQLPAQERQERYMSPFTFHREIDKLFENAFQHLGRGMANDGGEGVFSPRIDILASPKEYVVNAELPGIEEKDIQLELKDDTLLLKAEKQRQCKDEKEGYCRVERQYGMFQRVLQLPEDAVTDEIAASYKNGVLRVAIPRREPVEPTVKRIEIQ